MAEIGPTGGLKEVDDVSGCMPQVERTEVGGVRRAREEVAGRVSRRVAGRASIGLRTPHSDPVAIQGRRVARSQSRQFGAVRAREGGFLWRHRGRLRI